MTWTRWTVTGSGKKRTDRWQDLLRQKMLAVTLKATDPDEFRCTLNQLSVKGSRFIRFRSTPHSVTHLSEHSSHGGHLMISAQLAGTTLMRLGTNSIFLRPGDVGLIDTAYPFTNEFFGTTERAVAVIDKSLFLRRKDRVLGRIAISDPYFEIIRQHVTTLTNPSIEHNEDLVRSLLLSLSHLVSWCDLATKARTRNTATKVEIDSFIRLNIGSDLSVGRIAAQFGISKRKLFELYESEDQRIEQFIISCRLEHAALLLASKDFASENVITISEMAGFKDVAHFSRRFREAFGVPPSIWRKTQSNSRSENHSQ